MSNLMIKNDKLSFETDKDDLNHKLIIGDNYDVLKQLLNTHKERVDVIYIDPPYAENILGKSADTNYNNSITRNDLLSMLSVRLKLAFELLKDSGVIFCSIDDRNQSYLKCLFDEVFDEKNYYGTFIQIKGNTQNDSKRIQKNHEYILCYVKNYKNNLVLSYDNYVKKKIYEENYILGRDMGAASGHDKLLERENLGYTIYYIEKTENGGTGNHNKLIERENLGYTIYDCKTDDKDKYIKIANELNKKYGNFNYYISKDGKTFRHAIAISDYDKKSIKENSTEEEVYTDVKELIELGYRKIRPPKRKGEKLGCWTWALETFQEYWNNNEVLIKNGKTRTNVIKKVFVEEKDITVIDNVKYYLKHNVLPLKSIIDINNSNGTTLLSGNKGIIPGCPFSNPKNPEMLKYLFKSYNNKNALILDFFAGSGSTAQAVLDLNKEDNGNRTFILCTNNEKSDKTPGGIAYDITSKRLKRIMSGCCYDESKNFGWIKKNSAYGGNLEVFEIEESKKDT